MPGDTLRVEGLGVVYGAVAALCEVDLVVAPGEVLALLGPSGSGKSTLLHAVAGFQAPSAGRILLDGREVATPRRVVPPERRDVGVVFQHYALWPHLSALDTVAYPLRRRGESRAEARRAAHEILERLDVAHLADRRPAELSGGEQQRIGLARALARRPSLYLFDEPTAHLDTHIRAVFLEELVSRQRAGGAAAVYATHDAEEALGLADRVALLARGRVVQTGTPAQVYAEPVDLWAARLTGPASVLDTPAGDLLVRPEWAALGGDEPATVAQVWFRGPHSDYLLDTAQGRLLVREPGPPAHTVGERVGWTARRTWPLRRPEGHPDRSAGSSR
ncbi:MAG: ABC transporter ATP-binding protein [Nocardioides sp.]